MRENVKRFKRNGRERERERGKETNNLFFHWYSMRILN